MSLKSFMDTHKADISFGLGCMSILFSVGAAAFGGYKFGIWRKENPKAEKKDIAKEAVKDFTMPVVGTAASISLVANGRNAQSDKISKLATATVFGNQALQDYRKKTKEVVGEEKEQEIDRKSAEITLNRNDKSQVIFYEPISKTYIRRSYLEIRDAEYMINKQFQEMNYVRVQDWLEYLGIDKYEVEFENIGWEMDKMISNCDRVWLNFIPHRHVTNGWEFIEFVPEFPPEKFDGEGL